MWFESGMSSGGNPTNLRPTRWRNRLIALFRKHRQNNIASAPRAAPRNTAQHHAASRVYVCAIHESIHAFMTQTKTTLNKPDHLRDAVPKGSSAGRLQVFIRGSLISSGCLSCQICTISPIFSCHLAWYIMPNKVAVIGVAQGWRQLDNLSSGIESDLYYILFIEPTIARVFSGFSDTKIVLNIPRTYSYWKHT